MADTNLIYPYEFEGGKKAIANEVNANFEAVKRFANGVNETFREMQSSVSDLKNRSSRNIFEIYYAISTKTPTGAYPLWTGETIKNCQSLFSDFWKEALKRKASGSIKTVDSNAAYDKILEDYGQCGAFFIDELNGNIRLPKITNFIEGISALGELGKEVKAGLPNITGSTKAQDGYARSPDGTGAFNKFEMVKGSSRTGDGGNTAMVQYFDASASNELYGKSETVQPKAVKLPLYIQVANNVIEISEMNTDVIAEQLNNAIKDLQNQYNNYTTSFAQQASETGEIIQNMVNETKGLEESARSSENKAKSSENLATQQALLAQESASSAETSASSAESSSTQALQSASNASSSATSAASWAIGDISSRPEGSSKYWAEKAQSVVVTEATEEDYGVIKLATEAEAISGSDAKKAVTPVALSKVINNRLSTVFKYKGSVATYSSLPTTNEIGDVYNIEDTGANYAWTGTEWDKLSETVDLTGYYTKTETDNLLDVKADKSSTYTKEEVDALVVADGSLPNQTGNEGKFLKTNGETASWSDVPVSAGNIGDIQYTTRTEAPAGSVWCDGKEYSSDNYGDIYNMLKTGKLQSVDMDVWEHQASDYGSCGYFGFDSTSDTGSFRVPLLNNIYIKAKRFDVDSLFHPQTLPNIKAQWNFTPNAGDITTVSGAAGVSDNKNGYLKGVDKQGNYFTYISFDASKSSNIYQDEAGVNPNNIEYRAYVVLATAVKEVSIADYTKQLEAETQKDLASIQQEGAEQIQNIRNEGVANKANLVGNNSFTGISTFNTVPVPIILSRRSDQAYSDLEFRQDGLKRGAVREIIDSNGFHMMQLLSRRADQAHTVIGVGSKDDGTYTTYAPPSSNRSSILTTIGVNKSANGYYWLGNQLCLQYGYVTGLKNKVEAVIPLNIPFISTNYSVVMVQYGGIEGDFTNGFTIRNHTVSNFTIMPRTGGDSGAFWMAIGQV